VGGDALDAEIDAVLATMSDEQHAEPRFFPDNYAAWNDFFRQRYERELAAYDSPPPPTRNNAAGRRRWWSATGRTLENVLAHIEGGNFPVLGMPPAAALPYVSRRHGSSWMPRRMVSSSGLVSRSDSHTCGSAPPPVTPRTVKEPALPPPTIGRSSGALVIREGGAPRHLHRATRRGRRRRRTQRPQLHPTSPPRKSGGPSTRRSARSLNDLVPTDNALPMDATLAWSR
jgi:hypothetical protein